MRGRAAVEVVVNSVAHVARQGSGQQGQAGGGHYPCDIYEYYGKKPTNHVLPLHAIVLCHDCTCRPGGGAGRPRVLCREFGPAVHCHEGARIDYRT
jgi:hypothetical protein